MVGWSLTLSSAPTSSLEGAGSYQTTKSDAEGRYSFQLPDAPTLRWSAQPGSGGIILSRVLDESSLQGGDLGELNLRTAYLEVDDAIHRRGLSYRVTLPSGIECLGRLRSAEGFTDAPRVVPAGQLVLLRRNGDWGEHQKPLGPFSLKPKEVLQVHLP